MQLGVSESPPAITACFDIERSVDKPLLTGLSLNRPDGTSSVLVAGFSTRLKLLVKYKDKKRELKYAVKHTKRTSELLELLLDTRFPRSATLVGLRPNLLYGFAFGAIALN